MTYTVLGCLAWMLSIALAVPAAAVPLPPDSNGVPSGTVPPAGVVIGGAMVPFQLVDGEAPGMPVVATGTITWAAIREVSGLVRLEFVVANDVGSSESVDRFGTSSYEGYSVDADYDGASVGAAVPGSVDRNQLGARVTFNFGGGEISGIAPGESTRILYLRTNASDFDTLGTVRVERGSARQDISDVGPQPVPEPVRALGGLVSALGLLALRWRARAGRSYAHGS